MEFFTIASGSSGNCIYVGDEHTHVLIDCGISGKRMEEALIQNGYQPKDIQAIFVTHEHRDHIVGLGVMARRYGIPMYATKGTWERIHTDGLIGDVSKDDCHVICPNETTSIGSLAFLPFSISHDAAQPVAFTISNGTKKIGIATDLGIYSQQIVQMLVGSDLLLIEANHDLRMLETGIYPYPLKQRIAGEKGHLSNETAGRFISELLHDKLRYIILGHLSKENNFPDLALETVKLEISLSQNHYRAKDFVIDIAPRSEASKIYYI